MGTSIRKFLLINLLLVITITSSLGVFGTYYLDHRDDDKNLDMILVQTGLAFRTSLSSMEITPAKQSQALEQHWQRIMEQSFQTEIQNLDLIQNNETGPFYLFQIYDAQKKLWLSSKDVKDLDVSRQPLGLSDVFYAQEHWRVFRSAIPNTPFTFVIMERYKTRHLLNKKLSHDGLLSLLLTYPISVILIWFIIWRALGGLIRIADAVSQRAPNYLEPVDMLHAPVEVRPLIRELNKLFLKLQEALDREQRFAADAAHELRTPLAGIRTQAQVALKLATEEDQKMILNNVIAGVDRSSHVVQQLLTMGRLPDQDATQARDTIPLARLTQDVIDLLAPAAESKKIQVKMQASDTQISIVGNTTAIGILLRNLIDNAIRYTPENGIVRVILSRQPNGGVLLKVIDNGPGIAVELRARVFERFYRILGTSASGSGLGLSIVQQIAKLHQAEVKLGANDQGEQGLEVEVLFPPENS